MKETNAENVNNSGTGEKPVLGAGRMPRHLKHYWVCIGQSGIVAYWSLAGTKTQSIKQFLIDSTVDWHTACRDYGWKCTKVDVTFTPCT